VNRNKPKTIGKRGEVVEKPLDNCIGEELMHVATWYHGTAGPKFTKFGNKFRLARPSILPNFIALRQKVCDISLVEKFCCRKSRPKFTLVTIFVTTASFQRYCWFCIANATLYILPSTFTQNLDMLH